MLDNLYTNIGKKIKTCAKWIFLIEAILAVLVGIVIFSIGLLFSFQFKLIVIGIIVAVLGPVGAWLSTWILYAFGDLVEQTCDNQNNTRQILKTLIEEKKKHQDEKKAEPIIFEKEENLAEKLEYALQFQSNQGMIRYLKDIQDESVQKILKSPEHLIREQIKNLLDNM